MKIDEDTISFKCRYEDICFKKALKRKKILANCVKTIKIHTVDNELTAQI